MALFFSILATCGCLLCNDDEPKEIQEKEAVPHECWECRLLRLEYMMNILFADIKEINVRHLKEDNEEDQFLQAFNDFEKKESQDSSS